MNCNYKVKITDIQNKYQFKILCKGGTNSINVNDIYNLLPTTTSESTNVSISNTSDIKAKSIAIKGNTTQDGTPTPASPVDVKVVTGLNTITVSNSDNSISKDFVINFGDLEFCKIGTYVDYPFKENNKWYKYGAIGKKVLKGNETWSTVSTNTSGKYRPRISLSSLVNDNVVKPSINSDLGILLCNYYKNIVSGTAGTYGANQGISLDKDGQIIIYDENYNTNDISLYKTWLSTHNITVYWAYITPTITEITDTTLIKQLNNISNNIRTFEGGTNISSSSAGANPIINITTFNKLS